MYAFRVIIPEWEFINGCTMHQRPSPRVGPGNVVGSTLTLALPAAPPIYVGVGDGQLRRHAVGALPLTLCWPVLSYGSSAV